MQWQQTNVEGLVGLVKRRLWSLTLKEFKMLEKSQWLVCNTISMLNFFSVKEQFSYFFFILIPFCRITDLERTIQGFQNELDNLPDPSELQVIKIHAQ